jgi:hypothetical protein
MAPKKSKSPAKTPKKGGKGTQKPARTPKTAGGKSKRGGAKIRPGGGKVKPAPRGPRQATAAAAISSHQMSDLIEQGVEKLIELKGVTEKKDLLEGAHHISTEDMIRACLPIVSKVTGLAESYKGRLGFSEMPFFPETVVNHFMATMERTIDDMNDACFVEFATNLAWIDGALQMVTTAYYGMENQTDWVSSVLKDDAKYLEANLQFVLDFLFNVRKLNMRTEKEILDLLKPPQAISATFKGAKLYMLTNDEVAHLMAEGEHELVDPVSIEESQAVLKEMHRFRVAQRLLVLEKMEEMGEEYELGGVQMEWEDVGGGEKAAEEEDDEEAEKEDDEEAEKDDDEEDE